MSLYLIGTFIIENNVQLSDTEMTKHEVPNHLRQVPINMEQEKPNMSLSDKIKYLQKHFKSNLIFHNFFGTICIYLHNSPRVKRCFL